MKNEFDTQLHCLWEKLDEIVHSIDYEKNPIYYYCSIPVFESIIDKRELWLTDSSIMNDPTEGQWADSLIKEEIEPRSQERQARSTIEESVMADDTILPKDKEAVIKGKYKRAIDEYARLTIILRKYKRYARTPIFLCCFSQVRDKLSQWRAYSQGGLGFAIGLDATRLNVRPRMLQSHITENPQGWLKISPVIYDMNAQKELIKEAVNLPILAGGLGNTPLVTLHSIALMCKNYHFQEEEEVRIIYCPPRDKTETTDEDKPITGLGYRNADDCLSPYFKMEIDPTAITEVIIGPQNKSEIDNIKKLLKIKGFPDSLNVNKSNFSLR